MTREEHTSGRGHSHGGGLPARSMRTATEERPFAEVRKNLHDALRILSVHRWAFLVPCCLATSAIFVLSLYYPRVYSATAGFERRADPIMDDLPTPAVAEAYDYFRSTMVRDLVSVACMVEIADRLGLTRVLERNADGSFTRAALRRREAIARSLGGKLVITTNSPNPYVDLIRITYTGPDPQIGRKLVSEMKEAYIGHTLEWMALYLQNKHEYFSQEAAAARKEVNARRREQTEYSLENPYYSPTDPGAIATRIAQLELERRELLLRRRERDAQLIAERQILAVGGPPTAAGADWGDALTPADFWGPQTRALQVKIEKLTTEIEERRIVRGMTDEHPEIRERLTKREWYEVSLEKQKNLDRLAAVANGPLEARPTQTDPEEPQSQWERRRVTLEIQLAALEAKIHEIDISLDTNDAALDEMREAKQGVYQKQEEFAAISAAVTKVRHRYQTLDAVVTAIEPAIKAIKQHRLLTFTETFPARGGSIPVSPKAGTIVLLAILGGMVIGTAFVILAEVLDNVYRSSAQVGSSLGLPILEAIDEIVTAHDRRRVVVRRLVVAPLILGSLIGVAGITGSMAYLSLRRPWAYEKIKTIPDRARELFTVASPVDDAGPETHMVPPSGHPREWKGSRTG